MKKYGMSHNDIMDMPFCTFLAYLNPPSKTEKVSSQELAEWRAEGLKWAKENKGSHG
jgi:hypothetical protein